MLNYILAFSLLTLLNPFSSSGSDDLCIETKMGNKANYESAKMIEKKYHMRPCGSGLRVNNKVEGLFLSFDYSEPISDINEARVLLKNVTKDHYANILNSEVVKPYLIEPFTYENITISIFFHTKDGYQLFHPQLGRASFYRNKAVFVTNDEYDISKTPAYIKEPIQYFFDVAEGRLPPPVYKELQK